MYLLEYRFPGFHFDISEGELLARYLFASQPSPRGRRILAYWRRLCALSAEQLHSGCEHAREAARVLRKREDSLLDFNEPRNDANHDYWAVAAFWTADEAAALLLGKSPQRVSWTVVEPAVSHSAFADHYRDVRLLILRAIESGDLTSKINPRDFLVWASTRGLPVPTALAEAVKAKPHGQSMLKQCEDLMAQLSQLKTELANGRENPKERASDSTLIIGMAMAKYGFSPDSARSSTVSRIVEDMEKLGFALGEDATRQALVYHKDRVRVRR